MIGCSHVCSHRWKAILLGEAVSEHNERWSFQTAKILCQRLQQDTLAALTKVCTCTHNTKCQITPMMQLNLIDCLCVDIQPLAAVWHVCQRAAGCGQVPATGGELHPPKLSRGAAGHAGTWRWHWELTSDWCSAVPPATRSEVIG